MSSPLDIGSFDPYHNRAIQNIFKFTYDSLVNLRSDGSFATGLAEKWTAGNKSASFVLRQHVTCSDGTPMTASQVAAAISYVSDQKNASVLYNTWVPAVPLTATGDDSSRTVKVDLKKPYGFLLRTIGRLPIVCAKGLKNPKLLATASDGTGPFVLSSVVPGQSYTFNVRKGYSWGPNGASTSAPGTPAKVVIRIIENETTAANLMLSGELNFARVKGEDQQRLIARGMTKAQTTQSGTWLWFNHIGGRPAADQRVRQALTEALDLNEIVKVNTGGTGGSATGLIATAPKPCPGDTVAGQFPKQDAAAAGSLLDQAGWTKGTDGIRRNGKGVPLTLDLHFLPLVSPREKPTAELIAQRWAAVGVKTKLTSDTYDDYGRVFYKTGNFDVYAAGFGFDLPSQMMERLSGPIPPKGTNGSGVNNKEYNELSAKAVSMVAPASCPLWNQAEQALYRGFDIVPIASVFETYYLNKAAAKVIAFESPIPTSVRVFG
jgi:peptide/nickel transport system substrate-binding protein